MSDLGYVVQECLDHEILRDVMSTVDDQRGDFDVLQAVDYRPIGEDRTPIKAATTVISPLRGTMQRWK